MGSRNTQAMAVAFVAGFFLIIGGISGLATWETIKDFVTEHIADNNFIQVVFAVLIFIASLGGISVIAGGILIGKNKVRLGKLIITLGAGLGLIGQIFSLIVTYMEGNFTIGSFLSIGVIGLILSIVARMLAKK